MISQLKKVLFFMLILPLIWCAQAAPQQDAGRSQRFITIDFENVDINLFIKYISELTGRNFIIDKTVKGNVTIISPTKISEDEAYSVFLSVLDVNGFTTVEAGAVTKIVPAVKARSENIPTFRSDARQPPEDKVVTQLIPLKHTSPDEVKKILAPLVSKTSVMIAHTQSGILILTDTLSNIQRLISIIEVIDVADTGEEIAVLPLEFASAETISKVMLSLFQQTRATPQGIRAETSVKIVPYDRINALVVAATPNNIERVSRLVKMLDAEMRQDSGNIHVHYLQHASAEEMAKVLNFLPSQSNTAGQQENPGTAPAISGQVKIMADEETNSLLINASRSEYNVLSDVIAKLDIPRRMVYLEALILEVNTTKNFEVGVEWALGGRFSDDTGTAVGGFTSGSTPYSLLEGVGEYSPPAATGVTFGVIKQGIKIGGVTFPNIGAVLRAYKNDSDINIVSTPQILTTDNKEAEISVGENVPYQTSRNVNSADSNQLFENYEYRDVSTTLKITPQINQAETLRLDIATEVVKLKANTAALRPETFKRTAKTTVIVKNNETVVIGGIIGQDSTQSNTKVPFLGDIPLLGRLFRSDANAETQTNMFIFITPRIIKNPADLVGVTLKKEEQMGTVMPEIKKELFHEANAGHATHLAEIGFDKMTAGLTSEAKQYFQEALDIDPQNPYALYNLGVIHEEEGDRKAAEIQYRKVILTGTTMTAANLSDPAKIGKPLLQLARERLEALQRVETEQRKLFDEENGR